MSNQHDSFLNALPSGWKYDRLKDVVALRNEKTDEASADEDYLELEDIGSGTGRTLSRRSTLDVESAVTLFKRGDVLFGKLRPYLEKYYEAEFDGKCTGEILAFKPERIASRFALPLTEFVDFLLQLEQAHFATGRDLLEMCQCLGLRL